MVADEPMSTRPLTGTPAEKEWAIAPEIALTFSEAAYAEVIL